MPHRAQFQFCETSLSLRGKLQRVSWLFSAERVWRNKKAIPSMAVSWVEMGGVKHIFEHLKLRRENGAVHCSSGNRRRELDSTWEDRRVFLGALLLVFFIV
jgi:hypothetical protein